jgi:thioredoxin-like negative regulator of GroEL
MFKLSCLILFTGCVAICSGLYVDGDGTFKLTPRNFNRTVLQSDALWYVQFYSETCQYCQKLQPQYLQVAKWLQGKVNFGVLNMDLHGYWFPDVKGFPTIYVFQNNRDPIEYTGPNTASEIYNDALKRLR